MHRLALCYIGEVECGMAADLEMYLVVICIFHMPYHMYLVAVQTVCDRQVEMERIVVERLRRVVHNKRYLLFRLRHQRERRVTGKAMPLHPI